MSDLRERGFRDFDGTRPYTDEEWAVAAARHVLAFSQMVGTHYRELGEQLRRGEFSAINQRAKDMIRLAEAELQLWRDLEDETSFALAGAH